jgi:hypothetical protein
MHYGIAGPFTAKRFMDGFCFLGKDEQRGGPIAFYSQGFRPNRISNHAVESVWASYSTVTDCVAYSYIDETGTPFYVLNFPTGNATWAYDGLMGVWHERGWWNGVSNDRQRQNFHCYVNLGTGSAHYVGDWQNGNVYLQSNAYGTDNGTQIQRVRIAPHISDEQTLNFYHRFQLDMQTGGGTLNPILDWSDDGGHTFGQYGANGTAAPNGGGTAGQYGFRVMWWALGSSRDRLFKITIVDPVTPLAIVNAYIDCTAGTV